MPIISEFHGEDTPSSVAPSVQSALKSSPPNGPSGDGNGGSIQMTSPSSDAGTSSSDGSSPIFASAGNHGSSAFSNTTSTFSSYNASGPFAVPPPPFAMYAGGSGAPPAKPPLPLALPLPPPAPAPFYGVNLGAARSVQPNGQDLPFNDVQTVRFFYNLGVEYMWWWASGGVGGLGVGGAPAVVLQPPAAAPPPPAPAPPRPDARDQLSQELQNLGFSDRSPNMSGNGNQNVSKMGNKNNNNKQDNNKPGGYNQQAKGLGHNMGANMRGAPLGPRFKRGDGPPNRGNGNSGNRGNSNANNTRRGSYNTPPSNVQSAGGGGSNDNCAACCDDPAMGPPPPQGGQYYFSLPDDLMVPSHMLDPNGAYIMPGMPYIGYGYCPPTGYYATGPPIGQPPSMAGFCPPQHFFSPPNEIQK